MLTKGPAILAIFAFVAAGFGCSALLPLTVSLGEEQFPKSSTSGPLIATYQVGYGIAAFGVGPLTAGGVGLGWVFLAAGAVAVVVSILAFATSGGGRPSPSV
jgi:MFS family permease